MSNLAGVFGGAFNAEAIEPQQDFSPLPPAVYAAAITDSEIKSTKAGDGIMLNLTFTILEGQYQNRKVFDRLNLQNPSAKAQEIGQRALSTICRALGRMEPNDSAELHNQPMNIKVGYEEEKAADGKYYTKIDPATNEPTGNEIKAYKPYDPSKVTSEQVAGGAPQPTPQQQPQPMQSPHNK